MLYGGFTKKARWILGIGRKELIKNCKGVKENGRKKSGRG
jgi:hypothetical protein